MKPPEQYKKMREKLDEKNLDALLLINPRIPAEDPSFYYFTGLYDFEKSIAILGNRPRVYVPDFEIPRAKKNTWIKSVHAVPKKPIEKIAKKLKNKKIGINGRALPVSAFKALRRSGIRMRDVGENIEELRLLKTSKELRYLKKAVSMTKELLKNVDTSKREQELKADFIYELTKKGADFAYDPIIAYDKNGALPHAKTTFLRGNKCLLLDVGARCKGYHADITRTFLLKKDKRIKKVHEVVREAHDLAIDAVQPGVKASAVDKICRDHLKKHGFKLVHSTGHGIGLSIHELPYIAPKSDLVLEENMVFTIEPGVYIRGKFGVRIEDDIVVTKTGSRVL